MKPDPADPIYAKIKEMDLISSENDIAAIARRRSIRFLSLTRPLKDYAQSSGQALYYGPGLQARHWNAAAVRFVADEIAADLFHD